MLKALFILPTGSFDVIYGNELRHEIAGLVDVLAPPGPADELAARADLLAEVQVVYSGWGGPKMDGDFLVRTPALEAVFYGAGSLKGTVSDAFWARGITICSAWAANAVPVAEYTLSQILFCLKHGWYYARSIRQNGCYPPRAPVPGAYGSTVGIISLGMIGREVCRRLKLFDVRVIAYDPYATAETVTQSGAELVALDELFRRADVVSLHTPRLPETEGMITGEHVRSMKPGAAFLNTSRGAVVREDEMIAALQERPDIQAVLDVTHPEPPVPGSPLYALPNVVLTPHIAGSMDGECRRMGRFMLEETRRYIESRPLKWQVTQDMARLMA